MAFKMTNPFKQIAGSKKQDPIEEIEKRKKPVKRDDWEPAFAGADHSQEELDKMTKKEIDAYYN